MIHIPEKHAVDFQICLCQIGYYGYHKYIILLFVSMELYIIMVIIIMAS